ncbi:MAG: hypothetical protein ACLPY5_05500 [Candidatus Bathyarchaeia archaeon]
MSKLSWAVVVLIILLILVSAASLLYQDSVTISSLQSQVTSLQDQVLSDASTISQLQSQSQHPTLPIWGSCGGLA